MSERNWSNAWKGSKQPRKQRKYRYNAPHHQKKKFLTARLDSTLRDRVGTNSLPIQIGDKVRVMRGDFAGETGRVEDLDRDNYKVYIDGIERETVSGTDTRVPIDPSNVTLTKLDLDDPRRVAKYDVSEEDREAIQVEDAEEEDNEEETDTTAATTSDDATSDASADIDYEALSDENISDIKDAADQDGFDYEAMLAAEQANKERKTLVEWLEKKVNSDE